MSESTQREELVELICEAIILTGVHTARPTTLSYAVADALTPFIERVKAEALRDAAGIALSVHDRDWSHEQKIAISIVWKEIGDYAALAEPTLKDTPLFPVKTANQEKL